MIRLLAFGAHVWLTPVDAHICRRLLALIAGAGVVSAFLAGLVTAAIIYG